MKKTKKLVAALVGWAAALATIATAGPAQAATNLRVQSFDQGSYIFDQAEADMRHPTLDCDYYGSLEYVHQKQQGGLASMTARLIHSYLTSPTMCLNLGYTRPSDYRVQMYCESADGQYAQRSPWKAGTTDGYDAVATVTISGPPTLDKCKMRSQVLHDGQWDGSDYLYWTRAAGFSVTDNW